VKAFEKISCELIKANPYWAYWLDRYRLPDGNAGDYHYVQSNGSTMIIPVDARGNIFLVEQFRYLNQKLSIEFPGGGIKKGYSPEQNANEELKEEIGYIAGNMSLIGKFNPFNGVTDEICYVFVAEGLKFVGAEPEESELVSTKKFTKKQLIENIKNNKIWDGMTIAAWSLYYYQENL
jgi:8-oxo-dGTP pyrophosphatase MutT (NUDIX family)